MILISLKLFLPNTLGCYGCDERIAGRVVKHGKKHEKYLKNMFFFRFFFTRIFFKTYVSHFF